MSSPTASLTHGIRSHNQWLLDGGLALALTVWALIDAPVWTDPLRAVVLVAMTIAVAWRRRAPVAVLVAELVGVAALPNHLRWPQGISLLLAAYSGALHSQRRLLVLALVSAAGGLLVAYGTAAQIPGGLAPFLLIGPAWLAGIAMRARELRAEAAHARAERLDRERADAVQAERARIARELHDVVTHAVSVMVLQTGAARQIISHDQSRGRELLESVENSGRTALDELRRLLGVLSDDHDAAPLSPPPAISEVPALVEQVQRAGLPVQLRAEGQPRPVPSGVAIAAYRIVQEALTNVLKHAGAAPTTVTLRWQNAALELEIIDHGPPQAREPNGASLGRGLAGMHERAAMCGGTLQVSPQPAGGYLICARIPLEPTPP
jgi:signal transduction histidine kinase